MAPDDDDKPDVPFQGLPRPAAVRRRAEAADLPPATRSRDAAVEERDDDEMPAAEWDPQMRRDPRRGDRSGPTSQPASPTVALSVPTPSPPTRGSPSPNDEVSTGTPSGPTTRAPSPSPHASVPSPLPRAGLLTPRQRYEGRMATRLGCEGLAAALGLSPKNGEQSVRQWERERGIPEPGTDGRAPPRYLALLERHAAGVPEVAEYLREHQGVAPPDRHWPSRPIELLLLLAAKVPEVADFLREQGHSAPDVYFRNRRRGR